MEERITEGKGYVKEMESIQPLPSQGVVRSQTSPENGFLLSIHLELHDL